MFCPNCGRKFNDGEQFCADCGTKRETAQPVIDEAAAKRQRSLILKLVSVPIVIILIIVLIVVYVTYKDNNPKKYEDAFKDSSFETFVKELDCNGLTCLKEGTYEIVEEKETDKEKSKIYQVKNTNLVFEVSTKYSCIKTGICIDGSCHCKKHGYVLFTDYFEKAGRYIAKEFANSHSLYLISNDILEINAYNKMDLEKALSIVEDYKSYINNLNYKVLTQFVYLYLDQDDSYKRVSIYITNNNGQYDYDYKKEKPNMSLREYVESEMNDNNIELPY